MTLPDSYKSISDAYKSIYDSNKDSVKDKSVIVKDESENAPILLTASNQPGVDELTPGELYEQLLEETAALIKEKVSKEKVKSVPISEEVVEIDDMCAPQKSYIELMGEDMSKYLKKEQQSLSEDVVYDAKYDLLEKKINQLRMMILEASLPKISQPNTAVHALGFGSPGSGEVNIRKMDDIAKGAEWFPGDTIIWDGEKFVPGPAGGGGSGPQGSQYSNVPVGPTPPPRPRIGDLWYNNTTMNTYIFVETPAGDRYWVDTNQ